MSSEKENEAGPSPMARAAAEKILASGFGTLGRLESEYERAAQIIDREFRAEAERLSSLVRNLRSDIDGFLKCDRAAVAQGGGIYFSADHISGGIAVYEDIAKRLDKILSEPGESPSTPALAACGLNAGHLIAGAVYFSCVLPKNHEGEHKSGGTCFTHGPYVERCPACPPMRIAPAPAAPECSTCRLRRIGLPTPGYPHSPGCPEEPL